MGSSVVVAAIAGSYGVRGEVRLKSFTSDPTAIAEYGPLSTENGEQSFTVNLGPPIKNGFSARLSGITTKEQADALRGVKLCANREALPDLPEDEFYHADLIGLRAADTGGTTLGAVKSVQNHGAGDILEIDVGAAKSSVLLPFTVKNVPTIDLNAGRIVIDPPEGLFD